MPRGVEWLTQECKSKKGVKSRLGTILSSIDLVHFPLGHPAF